VGGVIQIIFKYTLFKRAGQNGGHVRLLNENWEKTSSAFKIGQIIQESGEKRRSRNLFNTLGGLNRKGRPNGGKGGIFLGRDYVWAQAKSVFDLKNK